MYATLTAAALAFAAAQPPAAAQPAQPGQPGAIPAQSIDGTWTILALEKNGQPVADARNLTVTIRGNTLTFMKAGTPSSEQKAMRLEFGQNGTVRVTEIDDNKFGTTAPAAQPGTTPGAQPGAAGAKAGVYIATRDFLAVCVHDAAAPRTGAPTTALPGQAQPATAAQPAAQPAGQPQQRSYCTVVLRRAEGGRPAASE